MTELERATAQIDFAHGYASRLIDAVGPDEWFRVPPAGVTHVAWQAGHLVYAEYRLGLVRIRGRQPGDSELIPDDFLQLYGPNPPDPDPSRNAPAAVIRAAFDRVHARVLTELRGLDPATLSQPLETPHPVAKTKLDSLYWCAAHAMVHAGQIGLLRRQLGHEPLW